MTNIPPASGSKVANLPVATSVSSSDIASDGMKWGINVGSIEYQNYDDSFHFDDYAHDVAASMASAGFSPSQVTQFVNAMYAGYLLEGGNATSQATGQLGSGVSTAGIVGNPGTWGSLDLPGQGGAGNLEASPSTSVAFSPSTALMLGQQLGSQPGNINYPQWRANLEADLQRAGYSKNDVDAFMGQFDKGYYTAAGASTGVRDNVVGGTQDGLTVAASYGTNGFNLEQYIAGTLMPYLTNDLHMSSPVVINEYVDSLRASYLSGGTSQNTGLIDQANALGADLVSQNQPNFNLEDYINNTLKGSDQWKSMNPQQQQMFVNALTAGYLRAGGTKTTSATTIGAPGVSINTQTSTSGGSSGGTTLAGQPAQAQATLNQYGQLIAASVPANALALYNQYVSSSNPTLSNDSNQLEGALNTLNATQAALTQAEANYAAAKNGQNPLDSSGHPQGQGYWGNLMGQLQGDQRQQWLHVRGLEATFYQDLSATSGDTNASMASIIYQNYQNDDWYTMEGEMPSSWTGSHIGTANSSGGPSTAPAAVSSGAYNLLLQAVSSSALPATVTNELTDPSEASKISQADFTQITQGYLKLYQRDPSQYYQSLAQIKDPNLAGAINFAVNDMSVNHPDKLQANGKATGSDEATAIGNYFNTMNKTPSAYYAWAPPANAATYTGPTDINTLVGKQKWNNGGTIENMFKDPNAVSGGNYDEHNFSDAAQFMTQMYHEHRDQYYQLLHQIQDPKLRDALNSAVLTEYAKNPGNYGSNNGNTGTGSEDTDFKAMWANLKGKSGFSAGSGAAGGGVTLSASSPTNGK